MKFILKVCLAMLFPWTIFSQLNSTIGEQPIRGFDSQKYRSKDIKMSDENAVAIFNQKIIDIERRIKSSEKETIIRPVNLTLVFHLLHTQDLELAKNQIQKQLDALNRDFSNKSLVTNHPNDPDGIYYKLARDTQISFSLKEGSIPDTKADLVSIASSRWKSWDEMKLVETGGIEAEQPRQFINVWVSQLPEGIASYSSSLYRDIGSGLDGIVLDAKYFNQDSTSPYNQGKTLTHLIGNYLGLHDLWSYDRHCQDDYVDDTPIHNSLNYGKPAHTHVTICPEENYAPEMVMNFMDNSDDELQTMFTAGQVLRMHTILNLFREGLINQNN